MEKHALLQNVGQQDSAKKAVLAIRSMPITVLAIVVAPVVLAAAAITMIIATPVIASRQFGVRSMRARTDAAESPETSARVATRSGAVCTVPYILAVHFCHGVVTGYRPENLTERQLSDFLYGRTRPLAADAQ